MRSLSVSLFVLALMLAPVVASSQTPQTYSITMTMGAGMTVNVARDGSRESLEQMMPKGANGPGMHIRQIYDFATHRYWTINFDGSPCVLATYTSPALPAGFDPISGAAEMQAEIAKLKPTVLRTETVNGFVTKVYEAPVEDIKGRMRVFVEEKYGFPVKTVYVFGDGKEQTSTEIKSVSFAKPPADLFVPPQNCRVQGGESGATGGHAETDVNAKAKGEVKLGEEKPAAKPAPKPAQKPAAAPASRTAAPAPAAAAQVTEVRAVSVQPSHYTGPAPAAYEFTFSVTASGPVEATWVLVNQADIAWQWGTLVFDAAGTKELKVPTKVGVGNGTHWEGAAHLEVTVGTARTSSEPLTVSADPKAK